MYRVHTLPTSSEKHAVENDSDGEVKSPKSIEDSLVLLQALRQSRQTWLTSAFTKFSTKSRSAKNNEIWQPPHTLRFRGKCDIEIGPHVFYATSVYEVTYQSYSVPAGPPNANTSCISDGSIQQPLPSPLPGSSSNNYLSITNELISQVNIAAQTNPTLANLIAVAASGSATAEQLQTLGVTLQSLAEPRNTVSAPPTGNAPDAAITSPSAALPENNAPSSTLTTNNTSILSLRPPQISKPSVDTAGCQASSSVHIPAREPDVLIEFYENSSDRWILPKDLVVYEKLTRWDGVNSFADIIFSTIFPFQRADSQSTSLDTSAKEIVQGQEDVVHPITLRFFNVPISIWNLFATAAADEERTRRVKVAIDAKLSKAASRVYLQHQISDGPLLSQLQASSSDRYPMKGIKSSGSTTGLGQSRRRASAVAKDGTASTSKRKKPAQPKKAESRTGTCAVCKRASIVLASDSDFCPPCRKKILAREIVPPPSGSVLPTPTSEHPGKHDTKASGDSAADPLAKQIAPLFTPTTYTTPNGPQLQNYYMWQSPYAHYQTSSSNTTMDPAAQINKDRQ